MSDLPTRRGFLALTGTGAATSLAGCSQLESIAQDGSDEDGALTVTVEPDQDALTTLQEEIRSDLESGEIDQQAAQQRFEEERQSLTEEAATPLQEAAETDDQVSIEQSDPSYGFFLVDAPAGMLVSALQNGEISAIYPGGQYERFAQRRDQLEQQQAAMAEQAGDGTPESDGSGETNDSNETNESTPAENESDGGDGDSDAES